MNGDERGAARIAIVGLGTMVPMTGRLKAYCASGSK